MSECLDDISARLELRSIAPPTDALRAHTLADVAVALQTPCRVQSSWSWTAYVSALAAALVIASSLSMVVSSGSYRPAAAPVDRSRVMANAQAIREIVPQIPESEAIQMSVVDEAGANIVCLPQLKVDVNELRDMADENRGTR